MSSLHHESAMNDGHYIKRLKCWKNISELGEKKVKIWTHLVFTSMNWKSCDEVGVMNNDLEL